MSVEPPVYRAPPDPAVLAEELRRAESALEHNAAEVARLREALDAARTHGLPTEVPARVRVLWHRAAGLAAVSLSLGFVASVMAVAVFSGITAGASRGFIRSRMDEAAPAGALLFAFTFAWAASLALPHLWRNRAHAANLGRVRGALAVLGAVFALACAGLAGLLALFAMHGGRLFHMPDAPRITDTVVAVTFATCALLAFVAEVSLIQAGAALWPSRRAR